MTRWLTALLAAFTLSVASAADLTLIYSGNTDGELEPCGCSEEGNLGGILRRATTVEKLRAERPGLFLVSSGGLLASETAQDRLTGEYILEGIARIGYDAIGIQWQDLAYGEAFIDRPGLPWVSSNYLGGPWPKERRIERGGRTLAIFSWLDPAGDPARAMGEAPAATVSADPAPLARALAGARADGALTLLATTLTLEQARATLPLEAVDILIIGSRYELFGEPRMEGTTLVLQPGSRGMRLGRVDLTLDEAGRIAGYHHQVIKMPRSVPDAPALADWYRAYNERLKQAYLERAARRRALESGQSPYAGEEACADCHANEHEIWWESPHAGAYEKLEEVGKAFDPNCVGCHTVGYDQPGGFIDIDTTDWLAGVQCENCHGAARDHAESGGTEPVTNADWPPRQMCAQCHVQKHSPGFDFDRYWPRIRHGLDAAAEKAAR